jgi:hypothetical protein
MYLPFCSPNSPYPRSSSRTATTGDVVSSPSEMRGPANKTRSDTSFLSSPFLSQPASSLGDGSGSVELTPTAASIWMPPCELTSPAELTSKRAPSRRALYPLPDLSPSPSSPPPIWKLSIFLVYVCTGQCTIQRSTDH